MEQQYRQLIKQEFMSCVSGTLDRVLNNDDTNRPFHARLLSYEALMWSRFERSFSTSFGQRVIEEIAKLVALSNGAEAASRQKETYISIDTAYDAAITTHIEQLRNNQIQNRDWNNALNSILSVTPTGSTKEIRIISDLWWRKNGIDNYMSIKTVKPNIDQTSVAKQDCLHLKIYDAKCNVYFGLPYNPFGEDRNSYAFNPPMNIFNFATDSVVLIGKDMWDTLGGEGCYEEILEIASEVGEITKKLISETLH